MHKPDVPWIIDGIELADSDLPRITRIEYSPSGRHLSVIAKCGGEEERMAITVKRHAGSLHSTAAVKVVRNVEKELIDAFVDLIKTKTGGPGDFIPVEDRTASGMMLIYARQIPTGEYRVDDEEAIPDRIPTGTALTPVFPR